MRVAVFCEESQVVTGAFRARGHEAYSFDLLDCSGAHPEWHVKGDALQHLNDGWDLAICHPPCTRLCNSGVRWLGERNLWGNMIEAAKFFRQFLDAPIPRIAVENPIPHRYALSIIGRNYDQIVQPWQFGHGETKATCLWLKGVPPLFSTNVVPGREGRVWKCAPSAQRACIRSKTYPGIAEAMAAQWGQS